MPSILELGQKVKAKYPGTYDDLPDYEVGTKVKEKFPGSYDDYVDDQAKGVAGFAVGAAKGIGETLQNIGNAALALPKKAIEMATPGGKITTGVNPQSLEATTRSQKIGKTAERVAEFIAPAGKVAKATSGLSILPRIAARAIPDIGVSLAQTGGNAKSAAATGAASAIGDALLGAPGKAARGAMSAFKGIAKNSVAGYAADVSSGLAGDRGADRTGFSAFLPGFGTLIGGSVTGLMKTKEITAPFRNQAARNIMNRVARLNPTDANKFKALTGKTHGDYLVETGNFKNPEGIIQSEMQKFNASRTSADEALETLNGNFKSSPLKTAIDELYSRESRVSSPGAPSPDLERAAFLKNKLEGVGLNMSEVNEAKRLYERNIKTGYLRENNSDGIARATNIDTALRKWQFNTANKLGLKNLPDINKQTQASKFLVDKLGAKLLGQSGNNAISLTDWVMLSGGDPTAIAGLSAKKLFGNKTIQSKFAKLLSTINPQGITTPEFGGKTGLPALIPNRDYGTTIEMGAPKTRKTYANEPQAQRVMNESFKRKQTQQALPSPTSNAQGEPIILPESITDQYFGRDSTANTKFGYSNQASNATASRNPMMNIIGSSVAPSGRISSPTGEKVMDAVDNHFRTVKAMAKDQDFIAMVKADPEGFLTYLRADIVDGLNRYGGDFAKKAMLINKINLSKANTLAKLESAVNQALGRLATNVRKPLKGAVLPKQANVPNASASMTKAKLPKLPSPKNTSAVHETAIQMREPNRAIPERMSNSVSEIGTFKKSIPDELDRIIGGIEGDTFTADRLSLIRNGLKSMDIKALISNLKKAASGIESDSFTADRLGSMISKLESQQKRANLPKSTK